MAFYSCNVINELGKKVTLKMEAEDESSLNALLKSKKYVLLKATKIVEKEPNLFFAVSSKVKRQEVILFLREFSVMINASISISDSLNALKNQNFTAPFKKILMEVYNDILSGLLLSEAFAKHPDIFPKFFCNMVSIGEISGSLDKVLKNMADYYEKDEKQKKKTQAALIYPSLLLAMIFIVVLFMSLFIIPKFEDTFKDYGGELPLITQIIFGMSNFINTNIIYIVLAGIFIYCSLGIYFGSSKGRRVGDYIKLKLPFIGKVLNATIVSRFTQAFVILLQSGMNITDCMENVTRVFDNKVYEEKFAYSLEEVKRGKRIAKSIQNTKLFPNMLVEMIDVGENTGNLEETLASTNQFFEAQVESSITKATAAMEPIIIIVLGLVVAAVLLSIYLPMITLMNLI